MRAILIVILCIFCASCVTQKACYQKFPPIVGVTDTVEYRDTVYYFRTLSDTVWAQAGIMDTVNASSGMTIGEAWVVRDSIYLKVIQRDTVFTVRDSIRTEIREVTTVVTAPRKFSGNMILVVVLAGILLLIAIIFKLL
jgi:hypothetical protein